MTDATGSTSYKYDGLDRLSSVTNGAGSTITYVYDADGEVTSIGYPSSRKTVTMTQAFDGAGRETSVTDWLSHTTSFAYDADGKLTKETYPNSTTATSTYDPADNLLSTQDAPTASPSNPLARMAYSYNANSQVQKETDQGLPGPPSQSYTYDSVDRLASANSAPYSYDNSGDPTTTAQTSATFNAAHQVTSAASTITRIGTSSAGDAGTGSTLTIALPSGTAPNDQILLAVTLPGNQSIRTAPSGYTLVGTYSSGTSASSAQTVLYRRTAQAGDGSATITFAKTFAKAATMAVYRGVNPTTPIDASANATLASGQSLTLPSVTATGSADELVTADGALSTSAGTWSGPSGMTTQVSQAGGSTIATSIADQTLSATGATGTRTAPFSTTGSLAGALIALQPAQSSYTYDPFGDRSTINASGAKTTLAYNQAGQMTGNGTTAYTYDGDGLLTKKTTGSTTEQLTWDQAAPTGSPNILIDGSTDYIYDPNGLPLEQINGSTVLYYAHDRLGSTRALTNSTGGLTNTYTYGPSGASLGTTGTATNPFQYTGQYTDSATGYVYLRARYYDPQASQLTAPDPLLALTQQPYSYAGDDPLNETDLSGLLFGIPGTPSFSSISSTVSNIVSSGVQTVIHAGAEAGTAIEQGIASTAPIVQPLADVAVGLACVAVDYVPCAILLAANTAYQVVAIGAQLDCNPNYSTEDAVFSGTAIVTGDALGGLGALAAHSTDIGELVKTALGLSAGAPQLLLDGLTLGVQNQHS